MSNFFEYSQYESTESNYNEFETERENFFSSSNNLFPNELNKSENNFIDNNFYDSPNLQNENSTTKNNIQITSTYRGRKPNESNYINKKKKIHNKFEPFNIRSKIKNNFFKFLISFLNDKIRKIFGYQIIKFRKLNYNFINIRNIKENYLLLNKKIKDILGLDISKKYKIKDENQNIITLNKIYPHLSEYLDLKFEDFYKQYFLKKYSSNDKKSKTKDFYNFINSVKEKCLKQIDLNECNSIEKEEKLKENNLYFNKIKKIGEEYIDFYKKFELTIEE